MTCAHMHLMIEAKDSYRYRGRGKGKEALRAGDNAVLCKEGQYRAADMVKCSMSFGEHLQGDCA